MRNILTLLFPTLLLLLATGCEEEVLTPATGSALETYYPLELNRPAYYRVDSIVLTPTVSGIRYDTASLEARETLVETFVGADGATVYRGERWERADENQSYVFKQTFTVSRMGSAVVRSEDNLTFTKLVLPLREGVTWDGHAAFDATRDVSVGPEFLDVYNGWNYVYTTVGENLTLPTGLQLDSVVTVDQAAVDNLIDLRTAYERYAPGLGLVERYIDARHTQCRDCCAGNTAECLDLPWDEKAEKGVILHQTLVRRD
ncbi:hypothetical protein [Neolewinella litorea]|uniref:Lipoprotein n=1 Tax=Neolewinella litorea TaxID=2562452 RepID=A0A4S4NRN2_9BACT|nr:hypothetical protein [Neolewinella litorea]THH41875.1 hypothetical protein E4021_04610 [Neolewinella litorea]